MPCLKPIQLLHNATSFYGTIRVDYRHFSKNARIVPKAPRKRAVANGVSLGWPGEPTKNRFGTRGEPESSAGGAVASCKSGRDQRPDHSLRMFNRGRGVSDPIPRYPQPWASVRFPNSGSRDRRGGSNALRQRPASPPPGPPNQPLPAFRTPARPAGSSPDLPGRSTGVCLPR